MSRGTGGRGHRKLKASLTYAVSSDLHTVSSRPANQGHIARPCLKNKQKKQYPLKPRIRAEQDGPESRLEGGCAGVCLQRKAGSLLLCSLLSLSATQGLGPYSNSFQKWFVHGCPIRRGQNGSEGQGELAQ